MRVSVRLKQILWASALAMLMIVTLSPSFASGQTQFTVGDMEASGAPATQAQPATDKAQMQEARRALLQARKALAYSDVETAKTMLELAGKFPVDFKQIGDSPTTVQSMIDRQTQLEQLRTQGDRDAFNRGAASFMLTQSEALMYYQDFETAEMLITEARKFPVEFDSSIGNPDELIKMIEIAKNSAAAAQSAQNAQQVAQATSQQNVRPEMPSKKSEALKLMSQAQLAMDQEKWNEAKFFVDQAKTLGVQDNEFASNEARPWQLELKIQNALNRQSFDPAVIQTTFEDTQSNPINQAIYNPDSDLSRNAMASATTDSEDFSPKFNPIPNTAKEFYLSGLQALDNKNPGEARVYFERAWNNRDQLDGQTRQSIQDQLSRLTMSKPQTPAYQTASQASQNTDLQDARSQQNSMFKQLQSEIFKERAAAERLLASNPREALEKMTMVRGRIAQSQLDANSQRPLLTIIDRDLTEMQRYIDQNLPEIINDETNSARREEVELRRQRRVDVGTQLQKLVEKFNELIDEERFSEAVVVAKQARELSPDSDVVAVLTEKANLLIRIDRMERMRQAKEQGVWDQLAAAEESGIPMDSATPVQFGEADEWNRRSAQRLSRQEAGTYGSESDRRIWNTLKNQKVQGEYRGTLAEAMDQLSRQAGVNIVFDDMALVANDVQKDREVDVPIREPISLRSALQVILQSAGLVYVVENEVIKVTTRDASQTKLKVQTYYIGDLVMPFRNPQNPMQMHWLGQNGGSGMGGPMNVGNNAMGQQFGGGNPMGGFGNQPYNGGSNNGPQSGQPAFAAVGGQPLGGITEQDFQPLMDLIQNTIQPDTWQDTGQGLGTIEAFVPNLSLIVSQTQAIQDEIQDLLKKLRELNDVQIVVEVRFVSLRDEFFERVGIDFDFSINDNSAVVDPNADVVTGGSTVIGRSAVDGGEFLPTSDLDLRFVQNSFTAAEPIFGGFQAAQAANFGFAILSDIEVFFLIQAAKGDQRTSITQAPTVTMFNGQSASVNDSSSRPFVTSVIPVVGDFAVAHQPVITILPDGTNLNVTAVVSDDRRFVRLQLVPFFTQVTDVETFTFDGSTTTTTSSNSVLDNLLDAVDGGSRQQDQDSQTTTTQGITVQLPVLATTSVNTVVSVPDGGTVLMGGIKRMNESRTERGVPFLSNVPYVNRLFKNVGIGHETSNLMMMVTPRIIIQEEIEQEQVGTSSVN